MKMFLVLALCAIVQGQDRWEWVNRTMETVDTGVSFITPLKGYTGGDLNDVGPAVYRTTDGGQTWDLSGGFILAPVALVLSIAAHGNNVVVSGVIGESWSHDSGQNFAPGIGGGISQNIRHIGGDDSMKFGAAGTFGNFDGVAVTTNGGQSFTRTDAKLFTDARYAAWPTETTWYVAAGNWPQDSVPLGASLDDRHLSRSKRPRTSEFQDVNGRFPMKYRAHPGVTNASEAMTDGYEAQISKTTDGGLTWTTVFAENGTFYFNGIDCSPTDENHCCATGEASGSGEAGARIYCTTDGGEHWERTLWRPATSTHGYSLLNLAFGDDNEIHAAGAETDVVAPSAWFLHSTDGGKTWVEDIPVSMFGCIALDIDMLSPEVGFAALDDIVHQSGGVAKLVVE